MDLKKQISLSKAEFITTLLVFLLVTAVVMTSRLVRLTSDSSIIFQDETELILEDNIDLTSLTEKLSERGIEFNEEEIEWASRILGWKNFQKGRYVLDGEYSYNNLLSKLSRGIQDPVRLVILPGITTEKFSESVSETLNFTRQELDSVFTDSAFLSKNNFSREDLLGRMLPETYLVYWTSTPEELIRKVLRQFEESVESKFSDRISELDYSLDEIITLASIVEWEAREEEEKPIISGLYWNRLERGMYLQADPTVNYALGERRRLLFEDYQLEHPFNTYVNKGLPPGPVTNPSLSTIEATLFPEEHDYLYMVASPDGGHVFTRSFREHQIESEKWRRWLRQQYRIKRQQEAEQQKETES